jgi:hypothetical protein
MDRLIIKTLSKTLPASLLMLVLGCSAEQNIKQWQLPPPLDEISGLTLGNSDSVLLHDDEIAVVYEVQLDTGDVSTVFRIEQPTVERDFEGIAHTDSALFLITSEGELFRVSRSSLGSSSHAYSHAFPQAGTAPLENIVSADVFDTGILEFCEIEGLHALNNYLYIACKTPYLKLDKHKLVLFEYSLESHSITNEFRFDLESLQLKKFNTSAIWLDEQSIYMLSAKQHRIIEFDWAGSLLRQFKLDKRRHPQPEGLVVDRGRVIIADEGNGDGGRITIYPAFPSE